VVGSILELDILMNESDRKILESSTIVMNPTTAYLLATSGMLRDLVALRPGLFGPSMRNRVWGIPDSICGMRVLVDDRVEPDPGRSDGDILRYFMEDNIIRIFLLNKEEESS
jgi:hypothetical protein